MGIDHFLAFFRHVHLNSRISPLKFLDDRRLTFENLLKIEEADGKSRLKENIRFQGVSKRGGLRGSGFGTCDVF